MSFANVWEGEGRYEGFHGREGGGLGLGGVDHGGGLGGVGRVVEKKRVGLLGV